MDKTQLTNGDYIDFPTYHHQKKPTKDKSIWTIANAKEEEICLANEIIDKNYKITKQSKIIGFNVKRQKNKLVILGEDIYKKDLKLSRFEQNNQSWHGYPVNHMARNSDKPDNIILDKLYTNNKINIIERKRILQGKPL